MAQGIYTNLKEVPENVHGMFESSRIKESNHLYDVLATDGVGTDDENFINVDNGVALKLGDYTGVGLQERYGKVAEAGDAIVVSGAPAIVKNATTKAGEAPFNYFNRKGTSLKAYEIIDEDIFAVASYQFTEGTKTLVKFGNYVVVNGDGLWKAVDSASAPDANTYGFIGKIHSLSVGDYYTMVRIQTIKNAPIA